MKIISTVAQAIARIKTVMSLGGVCKICADLQLTGHQLHDVIFHMLKENDELLIKNDNLVKQNQALIVVRDAYTNEVADLNTEILRLRHELDHQKSVNAAQRRKREEAKDILLDKLTVLEEAIYDELS